MSTLNNSFTFVDIGKFASYNSLNVSQCGFSSFNDLTLVDEIFLDFAEAVY